MKKNISQLLLAVLLVIVSAGCISFSPPKHEKRPAFMVASERKTSEALRNGVMGSTLIKVRRFRTAEPYDTQRMILQNTASGKIEFLKKGDFAVSPGITTSHALRRWLADSKAFAGVVDSVASVRGNVVTLDGWVEKAGIEIGEDDRASFKLAITVWCQPSIFNDSTKHTNFMHETSVPLESVQPSEIAAAFGKALETILTQFEFWLIESFEKQTNN